MAEQDPTLMTGADDITGDEDMVEDEPQQESPPGGGFMTADQVEALLQRQQDMMVQQNQRYMDTVQQVVQPPAPPPQQVQMPTAQEVQEAFEAGDGRQFMDVYQRSLAAVHQASEARIQALENVGLQRIQELSAEVVQQSVPELKKYEKEVTTIMDDFGIQGDLRSNPKVVSLLVDAAKGRNLEHEIAAAEEARKRQAASRQTSDVTSNRSAGGTEPEEPLFGMGSLQALRNAGRSPDQHAQALGYTSWEEFQRATAEKYDNWQERSQPAWRKRLNERRAGRRTA